ncbi:MAG: ABC transporter permease [Chloroflexota bacterium]|nr:ABC transporter permease [Chloroflexota bacterium]MBI5703940.1 ABC transporter permease [Chloroflexota bacterium]
MIRKILVVTQKEILDHLRDYRTGLTTLLWGLFVIFLMGGMTMLLGANLREKLEKPFRLSVAGMENAPNLLAFMAQQNVIIEPAPADPKAAVIAGDISVALIIPPEYSENFSSGKTATIQLVYDSSRTSVVLDKIQVEELLKAYNRYIGLLRLSVRGINPRVIDVVQIEGVDTATPQSKALLFFSMLPYIIISVIFTGAASIITDATAGERERESLEPLLINPLPRGWFAIGKMLAAIPFTMLTLIITLAAFAILLRTLPLGEIIGIRPGFDAGTLATILLLCLPVIFLAAALQTLVASFTKTVKEANTHLPYIALIAALPGALIPLLPIKPALWMMLTPILGQQVLINQILHSEPISAINVLVASLGTSLVSIGITFIAVKFYESERIISR